MPIPVILKIQISLNKRIGMCFLFSFGLGTCVISAVRMFWIFSLLSTDITCKSFKCPDFFPCP